MSDYEQEDKAIRAWLESRDDEAYEEYQIRREEMREEMMYARQQADDKAELKFLARTCPVCEAWCPEADYDPADPSVGIWSGVYTSVCLEHGIFCTYDDGSQELEVEVEP